MRMLSEDDLNLQELTDEELDQAWDLWFDLAQSTNDWDPLYSHGVLVDLETPGDWRAVQAAPPASRHKLDVRWHPSPGVPGARGRP